MPLLTEEHLLTTMGLKLGPALKIRAQAPVSAGGQAPGQSLLHGQLPHGPAAAAANPAGPRAGTCHRRAASVPSSHLPLRGHPALRQPRLTQAGERLWGFAPWSPRPLPASVLSRGRWGPSNSPAPTPSPTYFSWFWTKTHRIFEKKGARCRTLSVVPAEPGAEAWLGLQMNQRQRSTGAGDASLWSWHCPWRFPTSGSASSTRLRGSRQTARCWSLPPSPHRVCTALGLLGLLCYENKALCTLRRDVPGPRGTGPSVVLRELQLL